MNRFPSACAVALAAPMLLATPAWGADSSPPPSPSAAARSAGTGLGKARSLFRAGRYEEALAVLRPLAGKSGVEAGVRFHLGLAAMAASRRPGLSGTKRDALLDEAIAALHAMLVDRPGLVRVRLELARALFLKGEDDLAKRHFEMALAGNPPAGAALNAGRFLAQIRARKRWSTHMGVALAPDTDLGGGSDERTVHMHGPPFRRDGKALTRPGIGLVAWAGGEYQYPLGDAREVSGASRWRLRAGAGVSRREYRSDEFDRMTVSAHLGPRWLIGRATEASLLAVVRQNWLSDEADHRDIGLRVEARKRFTRRTTVNAQVSRVERRHADRDHLDGPVTGASLGAGYVLSPTIRIDGGVGWGRERPELKRERNTSRWMRAGVTAALPWGFTVGAGGTLRWTDYRGNRSPFTADGPGRRDLTRSLRLDVHNRGFTVGGFSPRVSLVREDRASNAQLHDYERISGELRFVRLF